MNLSNMI